MTDAMIYGSGRAEYAVRSETLRLWPTLVLTVIATLLMSLPNLLDPMVRHDDFSALFSEPDPFWNRTLNEGRWINYLWHLRGIETPAWLNFAIYQTLWASFAASIAVAAIGRRENQWYAAVLALLVMTSNSAVGMSLWFNTLIPGLAIVAFYAVLGCFLSTRTHRFLLVPFVVLSFMAYTMYPLLLLAVCIVKTRKHSVADLLGLVALFILSFATAVLVVYTINLQVHGVFGVPLADWRNANPASDIESLLSNVVYVWESLRLLVASVSFNIQAVGIFHLCVLGLAICVLFFKARLEALYLLAGLGLGLALAVAQNLKLGVIVPPRAFTFVWVFYAVLIVRATQHLGHAAPEGDLQRQLAENAETASSTGGVSDGGDASKGASRQETAGRLARNVLILIFACHFLLNGYQYSLYRDWQSETRAIAAQVAKAKNPILVTGRLLELPSAKKATIQSNDALHSRIRQLASKHVIICEDDAKRCEAIRASWSKEGSASGTIIRLSDD